MSEDQCFGCNLLAITLTSRKHLYFQKSYTAFYINCQDYYRNATMCERPLQLILIYISDFLRLDAQVIKRLSLDAVIKTYHKSGQVNTKGHSLMIAPCLTECMAFVVALEFNLTAPVLYLFIRSTTLFNHAFVSFGKRIIYNTKRYSKDPKSKSSPFKKKPGPKHRVRGY